ncbi:hypothetical protein [Domibacillus antri]|uniref:hypothetical protein n=1 Tax=Domibacillus antri TaxID=1714264 RepID=UPI000AD6EBB0
MITHLKKEKGNMIALLEKLVNIDSHSYNKEGVDKIGTILQKEFEALGMKVDVHREKNLATI